MLAMVLFAVLHVSCLGPGDEVHCFLDGLNLSLFADSRRVLDDVAERDPLLLFFST